MNFVVLSSSRGTTFQAVIEAMNNNTLHAHCFGLVTDRADRECIGKAKAAGFPFIIVEAVKGESSDAYDRRVQNAIAELAKINSQPVTRNSQLVVTLMGWMHILSPWFIAQHRGHILNVHPALLPKYSGEGMYGDRVHTAVLKNMDKHSGMTIHVVDEGVDTGPILLQKTCSVEVDDTPETLRARVQDLEREWYPKVLQMIEEQRITL